MNVPKPNITINVDVTNPGQFFACCGLLEFADRLWPGAEGWFSHHRTHFCIECGGTLKELLGAAQAVRYAQSVGKDDEDDVQDDEAGHDDDAMTVQPLVIESPIELWLDWWLDKSIKTWAGSMKVDRIASAMSMAIDPECVDPLNQSQIVFVPSKATAARGRRTKRTKCEPFYFDCRRATNSHSLDIGFSPNDLKMMTLAFPAVEFLCLIGLQRFRPVPTSQPRVFEYWTWHWKCEVMVAPAAVMGIIADFDSRCVRFENSFRSGQRKHKAFRPGILLTPGA